MLRPRRSLWCALSFVSACLWTTPSVHAQMLPDGGDALPEEHLAPQEVARHVRFLASDELMGREPGTPGADVAARYVAEAFRSAGLAPVPGAEGFFQPVPFVVARPDPEGIVQVLGRTFRQNEDMLLRSDAAATVDAPLVYLGFGLEPDFEGRDVRGKVVVVRSGTPEMPNTYAAWRDKLDRAVARGAAALVELYSNATVWQDSHHAWAHPVTRVADAQHVSENAVPHFRLFDAGDQVLNRLEQGEDGRASARTRGWIAERTFTSSNVAGMVEGSDPTLRNEVVVLTAHYDHVGARAPLSGDAPADTIYNGARDNAMGVAALLSAAQALGAHPPARSVLFLAVTAEEWGMLGSRYYAEHPLVPLNRTVYVLNTDGAGYNDTSIVTVVGLGRTGVDEDVRQAAAAFGLEVGGDPAPEQGLFDRSDNVSFASKGVPSLTFSPGFRAFDETIARYYHQPSDEVDEHFDFEYLYRFAQAYARTARLIADRPKRPGWTAGDKYEAAGRALYEGK